MTKKKKLKPATGDLSIPLAEVAVSVEDPADTFCGLCRPASVPVTWDPQFGYLCPRHGDGTKGA